MALKRSWRIHGSTINGGGDPYCINLKVTAFGETPEEAMAQFRGQFPKAYIWSVSHGGRVIVADEVPAQGNTSEEGGA